MTPGQIAAGAGEARQWFPENSETGDDLVPQLGLGAKFAAYSAEILSRSLIGCRLQSRRLRQISSSCMMAAQNRRRIASGWLTAGARRQDSICRSDQ